VNALSRVFSAIAGGTLAASAAEPLGEGAPVPAASQIDHDGNTLDLSKTGARGWLLVYFYPKADTPGCTKQACSLRDAFADLTAKGVKVIGVSNDSPKSQKAFREKYRLPFDLLADENGAVTKAFGVPTTLGFTKRQAFLFKDGKLVWRDLSASTDQQAADVLKVIGN
jgi:thioredoxin-dependent peroxiredoxin